MPTAATAVEDSDSKLGQTHPHDFTKRHIFDGDLYNEFSATDILLRPSDLCSYVGLVEGCYFDLHSFCHSRSPLLSGVIPHFDAHDVCRRRNQLTRCDRRRLAAQAACGRPRPPRPGAREEIPSAEYRETSKNPAHGEPSAGSGTTKPCQYIRGQGDMAIGAADQAARRLSAADLPVRRSATTSNETFCPSLRLCIPARSTALMCTKTSLLPSSGWMKPKPFWPLNHFTVPCDMRHFFQIRIQAGRAVAQPVYWSRFGRRSSVRRNTRGEAKSFGQLDLRYMGISTDSTRLRST